MAALDAAHIAARAHLLASEAGSVSRIQTRQAGFIQNLAHVQTGQRNFRGWHKIKIFFVIFVKIIGELWQLSRTEHRIGPDHERQIFFGIALTNMKVEHVCDQRALKPRARSAQHIEARAGDLRAALKVNDAERGAKVPMRLGLKVELFWFADRSQDNILAIVFAIRRARIGNVWNGCGQRVELRFNFRDFFIERVDLDRRRVASLQSSTV